ncbi:serine/threonine protein kinase [Pyxidicoccus fallax]|uniref:Serine/threonine protein kinase n=1 Tax=Pyxidicoccus fallax TaxID=394095 RepID=A0A848L722_9BACT|nr:serine/threonine-protein kinase [Pyxidicoccus fallax]NMO14780.1 serine/threonine protein kinase [Pyxidicoccus fallax]NPC81662.1 serine/threonine protein kinase [Pyxidicoccus fallax]
MRRAPSLDDFILLKRLALGAMSEVFLAEVKDAVGPDRLVALKRMRPEDAGDEAWLRQFLDEAHLATLLNHPSLARLRDFGQDHGLLFLVFEYVHGLTLAQLLESRRAAGQGPLPWPHAVRIASHVAEALAYLHALRGREGQPLGLVHRDLHPGNVMVADTGAVKLLDVGIACRIGRLAETQPGTVKARLEYASPEQLRQEPVEARTDVHGLALTLFEMLSGVQPMRRPHPSRTLEAVLTEVPGGLETLRNPVPEPLRRCVTAALAKEPSRRPSLLEVRTVLDQCLRAAGAPMVGLPELAALVAPWLPGSGRLPWSQHQPAAEATITRTGDISRPPVAPKH